MRQSVEAGERVMNIARQGMIVAAAAVLILAAAGVGQVRPAQRGQVLDANSMVGAGGVNTPIRSGLPFNSQLYVNGQVTGLGAFRGGVGYRPANQLGLTVPSGGLSDFRRQSTGLQDVLGGATAGTGSLPYYDRATTALGVRGITSGMAMPGSNVPRYNRITPGVAHRLYVDAMVNYGAVAPIQPGRMLSAPLTTTAVPPVRSVDPRVDPTADPTMPSYLAPALKVGGPGERFSTVGAAVRPTPSVRPGSAALFGVLRTEDRYDLARELMEAALEDGASTPVDERIDGALPDPAPAPAPEKGSSVDTPSGRTENVVGGRVLAALGGRIDRVVIPEKNQDVFLDILVELRNQGAEDVDKPEPKSPAPDLVAGPKPVDVPEIPKATGEDGKPIPVAGKGIVIVTTQPDPADVDRPGEREIVEREHDGVLVLHGLAGRSRDRFNQYMSAAEAKLRSGAFEQAAQSYMYAITLDGKNPLARLGMSLSLLASGEPLRAAIHLRRAMELFPPMMETRVDVAAIMDSSALERQLLVVDKRLDASVNKVEPLLALLSSYLHCNANEMEDARRYARRLRAAAPDDPLYAAYAEFVLTGNRPGKAEDKK